jgi:cytochrome b561
MVVPPLAAVSLGIYYERIAVSLGFATLASAIATFLTCRTLTGVVSRYAGRNLLQNQAYRAFYKYHSYYWWSFIILMVVHALSALMHTDLLPPPGDPDYVGHWFILAFAFGSVGTFAVQFTSCRSFAGMLDLFIGRTPLGWRVYRGFYRFHAWYWWVFLAAVGGHVIAAAIHTRFWPGWGGG